MVRNRLRTLGQFLKALKEINNEVTDFASLCINQNITMIVLKLYIK